MRPRVHFLAALIVVALGAALFAVSFRLGLSWWYRSAFGADNVVAAMIGMPEFSRLLLGGWFLLRRRAIANLRDLPQASQ